jgi:hypothetical protein
MLAAYRESWALLLGAGLLVFVPLGLIEALDNPLDDVESVDLDLATVAELAVLVAAQAVGPLLATVVYAGIVSSVVEARRRGSRRPLATLARTLPYGRLVLGDLLLTAVVAIGLIALLVPGVIFLTWFALVGPAIELEHHGVMSAFRRSRQLVRPHFVKVAVLVLPALLAEGLIAGVAESGSVGALGDNLAGEWAGSVIGNLLAAPIFALAVVVLFYELRARASRVDARR